MCIIASIVVVRVMKMLFDLRQDLCKRLKERGAERGEKGEKEKEEEARILFLHMSCIYIAHNRTFSSASSISVSDQRLAALEQ